MLMITTPILICHIYLRPNIHVLKLLLWCFCIKISTLNIFIVFFYKTLVVTIRSRRAATPTASPRHFYKKKHIFGMYCFYNKNSSLPAGLLSEGLAVPSVILMVLLVWWLLDETTCCPTPGYSAYFRNRNLNYIK